MATNNFKPFAIGNNANVTSQADYEALAALLTGFQAGKASSAQINKALRQSSVMAYVLAQFISDSASVDVLDNGTPAAILASLKAGMTSLTPGRLLNVQVFTASGIYTPTPGTKSVVVEVQAGGGGGGYARATSNGFMAVGSGGGAGGYAKAIIKPAPASQALTVGLGGDQGAPGGVSTFGTVTATGGLGGENADVQFADGSVRQVKGGEGGIGSGGLFNSRGANGGRGITTVSGNLIGGEGGRSFFSSAPLPPYASSGAGKQGGIGSGGTGAISSSAPATPFAGGFGGNGMILVWEYA
ncbi:hypothetical protein JK211_07840 [Tatumella sp. JGM130]|uniref:hypothetical protein n=1 Tax=Tatumella sp. JGM130 TaxID=2799797 RepID=UPI001BAF5C65|nr:hypothetical protein [Tatumella sp. JGM130]MBS0893944.1 hypothetical protein [Tatumella sp. JGM130]